MEVLYNLVQKFISQESLQCFNRKITWLWYLQSGYPHTLYHMKILQTFVLSLYANVFIGYGCLLASHYKLVLYSQTTIFHSLAIFFEVFSVHMFLVQIYALQCNGFVLLVCKYLRSN